jgi:predicted O-methyltransferase YrrM
MGELRNIARNSTKGDRWRELLRKVGHRIAEPRRRVEAQRAAAWAAGRAVPADAVMPDAALRAEAEAFAAELEADAPAILAAAGTTFGGSGHISLLYYLVRSRRPRVVVETGVAAGWSSRAVLEAMAANGEGHLWSSDLPYLRQRDSDRSIGCLVPDAMRDRWTLLVDGDHRNLPAILEQCGPIDLFHYDSDKSRHGRQWAMDRVQSHLSSDAMVVMDDIGDNLFFADLAGRPSGQLAVIELKGKYIGVLGAG